MNALKLTRCVLSLLLGTAVLLVSAMPVLAQMRQEQAKLTIVVGQVEVLRRGATAWQPGRLGMRLSAGDEIRAARGSEAEIVLADESVVKVLAMTRIQVRQLESEAATKTRNLWFHLVVGKIRFVVAKVGVTLVQARQGRFAISTPTAVAAIRGSDGFFTYSPATRITNLLSFRGIFAFMDLETRRQVFVSQGTLSQVKSPPTTPVPVPVPIQWSVLLNAPIRSPTRVRPTRSPVAGRIGLPAQPVPGAPATAPPPPPPPTGEEMPGVIPPLPPPGAPPVPLNNVPFLQPGMPQVVPLAPQPLDPTEAAAENSNFVAATDVLPPAPSFDLATQLAGIPVPPQPQFAAALPPQSTVLGDSKPDRFEPSIKIDPSPAQDVAAREEVSPFVP